MLCDSTYVKCSEEAAPYRQTSMVVAEGWGRKGGARCDH